jgi:hypothetical protein
MTRYCHQCNRRLFQNKGDLCSLCEEHNARTLDAHIALYGEDDPGLFQPDDYGSNVGIDGVNGAWHGDGWHWYD